jgi:UDP-N-acetylmuramoyl-L-alanyl-D-glutamate--2,6-diaminopimelate ligase
MESVSDFSGLASDSRDVKPGYLFAALSGSRANGAAFMSDAVKRGAVAVLARPEARGDAEALGVRFIPDENPRLRLARLAAKFFGIQPKTVAAVTGTNGKTSVSVFLRQIWERQAFQAASMGTIGLMTPSGKIDLQHTTPDPIEVHRLLKQLAQQGVDRLALEASSHGLDQYRLDGVEVAAAGFTERRALSRGEVASLQRRRSRWRCRGRECRFRLCGKLCRSSERSRAQARHRRRGRPNPSSR